jgi:hypothetical protein
MQVYVLMLDDKVTVGMFSHDVNTLEMLQKTIKNLMM